MSGDGSSRAGEGDLLEESRGIWDADAEAWDARMAAGSSW